MTFDRFFLDAKVEGPSPARFDDRGVAAAEALSSPHDVIVGSVPACMLPEFPHVDKIAIDFSQAAQCRACLAALVALAVNRPEILGVGSDGAFIPAPLSALKAVRACLDVNDPLRVRCEQELLPICAKAAA